MKRMVLGLASVCVLLAGIVMAEEAAAVVTVKGKVAVTKEGDAVKSITITTADATYNVTLDDNGNKLAALDGKTVEATGTVAEADGVKTITLTKEATEAAAEAKTE